MGNQALDALRSDALSLPESERAELAHDLLVSLDGPPDPDAVEAWEAEILRRLDQIDEGTAKLVDRAEFMRRIRDRLPSA
jgi:putative addiction module component (TIGR02574 family)